MDALATFWEPLTHITSQRLVSFVICFSSNQNTQRTVGLPIEQANLHFANVRTLLSGSCGMCVADVGIRALQAVRYVRMLRDAGN
jgi:hypothetical protein